MRAEVDVLVVGGGCAGLWTAFRLSSVGLSVMLVEQGKGLAPGPSTRNGGYVHGGGFHAAVIEDEHEASNVAERCRSGLTEVMRVAPEAVVPRSGSVHLLAKSAAISERAEDRWKKLALDVTPCSNSEVARLFPGLDTKRVSLAAKVPDKSVDYRILFQALAHRSRIFGCQIRTGYRFDRRSRCAVGYDGRMEISAEKIVYCVGVQAVTMEDGSSEVRLPEIGLWKSHVLTAPRAYDQGFMYLDPGEVSVMPQVNFSIICRSQDDIKVSSANYDVERDVIDSFERKLHEATSAFRGKRLEPHACLKPSLLSASQPQRKRKVDSTICRIGNDEWLALPGKATEAPIMATELLHTIFESRSIPGVSDRPGDDYHVDSN